MYIKIIIYIKFEFYINKKYKIKTFIITKFI